MYRIYIVAEASAEVFEQLGTKRKFWFWDDQNQKMLFKEGRPGTGENWAEKIACELCTTLSIPHAEYELARWKNFDGVVSQTFVPDGWRLVLGNEIISHLIEGYKKEVKYKQKQYTLRRALILLKSGIINLPNGFHGSDDIRTALDVFIGYLMFDAWIANQDRHHENWGVVVSTDKKIYLAPTFDHASGFGRNETDQNRIDRLTTKDKRRNMDSYAAKALTPFYSSTTSSKPLSTLDAFLEAARLNPNAARYWLNKLDNISSNDTLRFFRKIPSTHITQPAIDFAQKILSINKERLLSSSGELL